jgi:hypothetical protein
MLLLFPNSYPPIKNSQNSLLPHSPHIYCSFCQEHTSPTRWLFVPLGINGSFQRPSPTFPSWASSTILDQCWPFSMWHLPHSARVLVDYLFGLLYSKHQGDDQVCLAHPRMRNDLGLSTLPRRHGKHCLVRGTHLFP